MPTTVTVPVFQLPPRQIYLPGTVLTVNSTRAQAISLLYRFESVTNNKSILQFLATFEDDPELQLETLSDACVKGLATCKEKLDPANKTKEGWLVIACLPGYNYRSKNKVATICRIMGVKDHGATVEISCHAITRAQVLKSTANEAEVHLQLKTMAGTATTSHRVDRDSVIKLVQQIRSFIESYTAAVYSKNDIVSKRQALRSNFLLLSPLANVLYAQLTKDTNTLKILRTIVRDMDPKSSLATQLNAIDCFVTLFPFTLQQKCSLLFELDRSRRIELFNDLINFGNSVFDELTSLDFVLDNWNGIDSKAAKTNIITTHLKSLKFLVDDFNNKDGDGGKQVMRRPLSFGSGIGAAGSAPGPGQNQNENEDMDKLARFIKDIDNFNIPPEGKKLITKDYKRLQKMSPNNAEYHTLLSYLEIIQDIPWNHTAEFEEVDLDKAKLQLDKDHHGLDNVKDRVLEYLAILNLHNKIKSKDATKAPILLLTGPPGVGKTSLAKSIATTLDRKFQRISLGGLKDESEIKGHRRTYVGALPGLIIQALRKAQSNNPVILLDEIDKVVGGNSTGNKVNGDPAAALLEVLDPEQNINFTDHYIGFPVDLSNVLFLCTSNDHYQLSAPLLDRMELLEINGYNYLEKVEIVKNFILPRQTIRSGLPADAVKLNDDVILKICTDYTRESGVRNLERTISAVCRGKAIEYSKLIGTGSLDSTLPSGYNPQVEADQIALYMGIPPHIKEELKLEQELSYKSGIVNGLSYNSDGSGSKLIFEMIGLPSSGFQITMTGKLGEVLRESCKISISLVKSILNGKRLNAHNEKALRVLNNNEFHLHVPAGSISKDGPSAGITMTMCLMSLVLDRPVPSHIAMTGEITLRGLVLPIGGVMEKLLGAHLTQKIDKVLLPRLNRKDIIQNYLKSHKYETEAVLRQEEEFLAKGVKTIDENPEKYVLEKFGIQVIYVEELNDVLKACWDNEVQLVNAIPEALHL